MCRALAYGLACLLAVALVPVGEADARPGEKKAIWGPVSFLGSSAFPIYRELGARYWQASISWAGVAPTRPGDATDPDDPAYRWPADIDRAVQEARRHGIRPALMVMATPGWANGGRSRRWAPDDPRDYGRFMVAAARRYPTVRHWMIWGEPARTLLPMPPGSGVGPRVYARLLDSAYGALKRQDPRNRVIGGMTYTVGVVPPARWPRLLRLPNGRRPRMDMWGHNPYEFRRPDLRNRLSRRGYRGFSDIDEFIREIDRHYGYRRGRLKLWLSEYGIQSEHDSAYFRYHVSRREQARYLRDAYRIARRLRRVAVLGWYRLEDEPYTGRELNNGLITADGVRKPAFYAYRRAR